MFKKLALFGVILTLTIIVLEAYVRLSGVALVSPGQNLLANSHIYLTATLGLSVVALGVMSWQQHCRAVAVFGSVMLLVLVGLQAALGYWAQTIATMPIVITTQVMLGIMIFWLFFTLSLQFNPALVKIKLARTGLVNFNRFAILLLVLQIVLGIWVSANHAALVCNGFPQCNGSWWPIADYQTGLNLFSGFSTGYTGVFAFDAQVAANWLHRVGALVCFIVLSLVSNATSALHTKQLRRAGLWLSALLFVQIGSGIIGIKFEAPLWAEIAHLGLAALLMLPLLAISFYARHGLVETLTPAIEDAIQAAPVAGEQTYHLPEPESLYLRLKTQLKRTRSGLSEVLAHIPLGSKGIGGDLLEEIESSLIMADIGFEATTAIINRLTESVERHQLNDGVALTAALKQELLSMLQPCSQNLHIPKQDKPFVILFVGINGAGKTTTIGKLAKRLQAQGHSVMLAAGDTFRAAAVEQLQAWGERNNIHVVAQHTGADSASVIFDGIQSAQAKGIDVLIADTAGRLHTKSNLMDELKKVKRIIGKLDDTAPHEVLLVLDAGTGQNALSQTKLFNETVALTGLVLTKLDGTAKGGIIFALAKQFNIPIRFIGIGEGIDDLQDFDAESFVNALFVND
jgi:fused signal recognition particle receptor